MPLTHEMFGDGSRSAIDFEMKVQKEEDSRETVSSS
jgi:cyanate lyase